MVDAELATAGLDGETGVLDRLVAGMAGCGLRVADDGCCTSGLRGARRGRVCPADILPHVASRPAAVAPLCRSCHDWSTAAPVAGPTTDSGPSGRCATRAGYACRGRSGTGATTPAAGSTRRWFLCQTILRIPDRINGAAGGGGGARAAQRGADGPALPMEAAAACRLPPICSEARVDGPNGAPSRAGASAAAATFLDGRRPGAEGVGSWPAGAPRARSARRPSPAHVTAISMPSWGSLEALGGAATGPVQYSRLGRLPN